MIELKNINKIYGKNDLSVHAVKDVCIKITRGEMIALTGTSGSGKSTLLNIIGCLDTPTSGTYLLGRCDVSLCGKKDPSSIRNRSIGFVVQYFALINYYKVKENIRIPLDFAKPKIKASLKRKAIYDVLTQMDIEELKDKYPDEKYREVKVNASPQREPS